MQYTHTHAHTHACTHARTHANTHTHTHTHTHSTCTSLTKHWQFWRTTLYLPRVKILPFMPTAEFYRCKPNGPCCSIFCCLAYIIIWQYISCQHIHRFCFVMIIYYNHMSYCRWRTLPHIVVMIYATTFVCVRLGGGGWRRQKADREGRFSITLFLMSGVPQGSVLGPILFTLLLY